MRIFSELGRESKAVVPYPAATPPRLLPSPANRILKPVLDRLMAVAGLVFFAPVFICVLLLIAVFDNGPIFFCQLRLGQGGRLFRCYKFRTMVMDADKVLEAHLQADSAARTEWQCTQKLTNDPRVSCLGAFLRKTSLDELPQLWNVLRGDMSIVGPRPILTSEMWRYGDKLTHYYAVRPGITGLWQVSGRSDTTYEERVALDCQYAETQTLRMDLKIILRTFRVVLFCKGAR